MKSLLWHSTGQALSFSEQILTPPRQLPHLPLVASSLVVCLDLIQHDCGWKLKLKRQTKMNFESLTYSPLIVNEINQIVISKKWDGGQHSWSISKLWSTQWWTMISHIYISPADVAMHNNAQQSKVFIWKLFFAWIVCGKSRLWRLLRPGIPQPPPPPTTKK